jgi:hypothetical protein
MIKSISIIPVILSESIISLYSMLVWIETIAGSNLGLDKSSSTKSLPHILCDYITIHDIEVSCSNSSIFGNALNGNETALAS